MTSRYCECGESVPAASSECPRCGAAVEIAADLPVASMLVDAVSFGTVQSHEDASTGDATIAVNDLSGVHSQSHTDGPVVSIDVHGTSGIGRENEGGVANVLRERLAQEDIVVQVIAGVDERGEDRVLQLRDEMLVLQATTLPGDSAFWRRAHLSGAAAELSNVEALELLRTAINEKVARTPPSARSSIVLAIDARHAGVFGTAKLLDDYLETYGCPVAEFGWSSVWVVGPTASFCNRVGGGRP